MTSKASHAFKPGRPLRLFDLQGPATVRALKLTVPRDRALDLSEARLLVSWDCDPSFMLVPSAPLKTFAEMLTAACDSIEARL